MAVYRFSALRDGQALAFHPNTDFLSFDQAWIAAADVRAVADGANLRISFGSKDVLLTNVSALQLATSNVGFANGSKLLFGEDSPGTAGDNGDNTLNGSSGRDLMNGFG